MYSRCSRYFKGSPADRESDSALAELLSGNTLADQSSLPRWMLFVLDLYFFSLLVTSKDIVISAGTFSHLPSEVFVGRSSDGRPAAPCISLKTRIRFTTSLGTGVSHTHTHTPLRMRLMLKSKPEALNPKTVQPKPSTQSPKP